ncbi:hypothetical protein [Bacillus sp. 2205SS5-2]|uniref:hypothetical protein n=1 Tax=Bacillus sp. 2205SS5-2 TaxID=3109031 RepID=UPI003003F801
MFKLLELKKVQMIIEKLIQTTRDRLKEQQVDLSISERVKLFVAEQAFDPIFGARPLKRYLQREFETNIAREIFAGNISPYDSIFVDIDGEKLVIKTHFTVDFH